MYESALVVAAVSASMVFGDAALRRPSTTGAGRAGGSPGRSRCWPGRTPSCSSSAWHVALWVAGRTPRDARDQWRSWSTAGLAAIPAALYFGASKIALGAFSVSSAGRSFSLEEYASTARGISYSSQALDYFRDNVVVLVCALLGLALFAGQRGWLRTFGWGAVVGYGVLLTVVVPATNEVERYFTPVAPVVAAGIANLLVRAVRAAPRAGFDAKAAAGSRTRVRSRARDRRARGRPGRSLPARAVPERLRLHLPGDHGARVRGDPQPRRAAGSARPDVRGAGPLLRTRRPALPQPRRTDGRQGRAVSPHLGADGATSIDTGRVTGSRTTRSSTGPTSHAAHCTTSTPRSRRIRRSRD